MTARRTRHNRQPGAPAPAPMPKRGRALLALVAAIAVPAMAAPAEWNVFSGAPAAEMQAQAIAPMPFEIAGASFPGSAFFYLDAPQSALTQSVGRGDAFDPLAHWDGDPNRVVQTHEAGPAARAFHSFGTGIDRARALQCLAKAVYYEAASESIGGQQAVAQVVLNRVAHPTYPNSVCGVVFQGSERRTGCQFSFTCDGSLARVPSRAAWNRALSVASAALAGEVYEPVGLATHYHTIWISPYWAPSLTHIGTIGAHRFYRWRGVAGTPGAFTAAYRGSEPAAVPHPRTAVDVPAPAADPISLARAYEEARLKAIASTPAAAARAPAPAYSRQIEERGGDAIFTADKLPDASGVKAEYANSGRWIAQPN